MEFTIYAGLYLCTSSIDVVKTWMVSHLKRFIACTIELSLLKWLKSGWKYWSKVVNILVC